MAQLIIQWIIFIGALLFFLVGVTFNGLIAWREWIEKESDGPSLAPLISGAIGVVAVLSAPFGELSERLPFLWIPIVFDFGTGPYFLMVVCYLIKGKT